MEKAIRYSTYKQLFYVHGDDLSGKHIVHLAQKPYIVHLAQKPCSIRYIRPIYLVRQATSRFGKQI